MTCRWRRFSAGCRARSPTPTGAFHPWRVHQVCRSVPERRGGLRTATLTRASRRAPEGDSWLDLERLAAVAETTQQVRLLGPRAVGRSTPTRTNVAGGAGMARQVDRGLALAVALLDAPTEVGGHMAAAYTPICPHAHHAPIDVVHRRRRGRSREGEAGVGEGEVGRCTHGQGQHAEAEAPSPPLPLSPSLPVAPPGPGLPLPACLCSLSSRTPPRGRRRSRSSAPAVACVRGTAPHS